MSTHELLEQHESAEHTAEHGNKRAALLIALLAGALTVFQQQAKHQELKVEETAVAAADTWSQYQAKSVRATMARDLADLAGATATDAARVEPLIDRLRRDADQYERDPSSGKEALSVRARALESEHGDAILRTHSYENGVASIELGIVLATASVITASRWLLRLAVLLGIAGLALGVCGWAAPEIGALGG